MDLLFAGAVMTVRRVLLILTAVVLIGGTIGTIAKLKGILPWSFTRKVEDRARYYRLKVDLHYRGTPVHFDIVADIGTTITTHKDGGRSMGPVAIAPFAYGLRMPDNKAVVIKLPELWQGETTANGGVPPDMIPFIAVYPDADRPAEGIGYGTEDAYESPLSELKFGKAEVLAATRAEWEAWRAIHAGWNIIKPEMLHWTLGVRGSGKPIEPGKIYFGGFCYAAARHRLSEEARAAITPFWRERDSEYWAETIEAAAVWRKHFHRRYDDLPKYPYELATNYDTLPLRLTDSRRAAVEANHKSFYRRLPANVYPHKHLLAAHARRLTTVELPQALIETAASGAVPADGITEWEVQVRPELRGFFSCSAYSGILTYKSEDYRRSLRSYTRINGGLAKPPAADSIPVNISIVYERADFRFLGIKISLFNEFGGL